MDYDKIKHIVITLLVCLTIVGIATCITYGVIDNNTKWYTAEHECIVNGGSWMPEYDVSPLCTHGYEVKP
jgi:hypothetical protein